MRLERARAEVVGFLLLASVVALAAVIVVCAVRAVT